MQSDEESSQQVSPDRLSPEDYEHVDKNFGDNATLRAAPSTGPRMMCSRYASSDASSAPFLVDPESAMVRRSTGYGAAEVSRNRGLDYLIGIPSGGRAVRLHVSASIPLIFNQFPSGNASLPS
jgi:hypothetical protein